MPRTLEPRSVSLREKKIMDFRIPWRQVIQVFLPILFFLEQGPVYFTWPEPFPHVFLMMFEVG